MYNQVLRTTLTLNYSSIVTGEPMTVNKVNKNANLTLL